jgi:hypothetical protein
VPAVEAEVTVPSAFVARRHPLEEAGIHLSRSFEVDLTEVDETLRGQLRVCLLTDDAGAPVVSNGEAAAEVLLENNNVNRVVKLRDGSTVSLGHTDLRLQVCADGILVAGETGRDGRRSWMGHSGVPFGLGGVTGLIDARGASKPHLTPARTPPRHWADRDPTWNRLHRRVGAAYSELVERVALACDSSADPATVWKVFASSGLDEHALPVRALWNEVKLPFASSDGASVQWKSLSEIGLGRVRYESRDGKFVPKLTVDDGWVPVLPDALTSHIKGRDAEYFPRAVANFVTNVSTIRVSPSHELLLTPTEPMDSATLSSWRYGNWPSAVPLARFDADAKFVGVRSDFSLWNLESPLVKHARSVEFGSDDSRDAITTFVLAALWRWPLGETGTEAKGKPDWRTTSQWTLGRLYRAIEWGSVPQWLQLPYTAFVPGAGIEELTVDLVEEWGRSAP